MDEESWTEEDVGDFERHAEHDADIAPRTPTACEGATYCVLQRGHREPCRPTFAAIDSQRRISVQGCATCELVRKHGFGPHHDASPRCDSGRREHCTCDGCF